jgi:hypothetical protein
VFVFFVLQVAIIMALKLKNKIGMTPFMANLMDDDCCDFGIVYVSFQH